jgi:hypothetical protein
MCVYREVAVLKEAAAREAAASETGKAVAIVSYDEKPGVQAIGTRRTCLLWARSRICPARNREHSRRD